MRSAASSKESAQSSKVVDFEKFLGDLSATFVRVPVEQIDSEIERWLEHIVLAMDVDRSTVVQTDFDDGAIYTTHQWAREGVDAPERGRRLNDTASYPWL